MLVVGGQGTPSMPTVKYVHMKLCLVDITFLFLVLRIWKGKICFFSRSHATASVSIMQDLTPSPKT